MKNKSKESMVINLIFGMILLSMMSIKLFPVNSEAVEGKHNIVYINSNVDGVKWSDCPYVTGEGSEAVPYILEDLIIDAGTKDSGIYIENSKVHVLIQNCTVTNSGSYLKRDAGITLIRCSNIKIKNCTLIDNYKGIYSAWGTNNQVLECQFINNSGIGLYPYVSNNGVYSGNNISGSNQIGLYSHLSTRDTFSHNLIEENLEGASIFEGNMHSFTHNIIRNNSKNGLAIFDTSNITVSQNQISDNGHGIYIKGNSAWNSIYTNILSDSKGNQAYKDGTGVNNWDNGTHGNFWNDYSTEYPEATHADGVWETPYQILGSRKADYFPLFAEPAINFDYIPGSIHPIMETSTSDTDPSGNNSTIPGYTLFGVLISLLGGFSVLVCFHSKKLRHTS